ncbi:MAG: RagB/SusD family nutrient uptake outer membrane protein [Prevotella sp.]|nr:RagB/SusD family nutrient uptake outer membrane protein [Prevotella sp.]
MKLNKIKSYVPAIALAFAFGMTSCVNDLDVTPIDPQTMMDFDDDAVFNKIYASFSLTGQQGPSDNGDVADIDEGSSAFYRMGWYLNEFTTDEASWVWASDAGVPDLLHNTYGASNDFSVGMYYRLYFTITLCNFYLDQTSDSSDEEIMRRAEVRLIRAINYLYVMDLYGNAAFTIDAPGAELAEYYTRQQFYDFVESEFLDVESSLADAGANTYGRLDKVADWLLLARLYLNAEVYTGTAQWEKARTYAKQVLDNGYYHINTTGAVNPVTGEVYSAYQLLFMGDNNTNGAQYEAIFPILCDGVDTESYGNSTFLVLGCYGSAEDATVPSGSDNSWGKCVRVRRQLLDQFFSTNADGSSAAPITDNLQAMIDMAGDDRALFFSEGYTADTPDESDANAGFSCVKFRTLHTDNTTTSTLNMSDMDIPFLRVAEANLIYAECDARLNGGNTTSEGTNYINELRKRANASTQSTYSLSYILSEWSREFWMEGLRRPTLVRFGYYGGQSSYKWEWMGGTYEGSQFSSNRNIYAIPENDLSNNANLVQNPGY